jgi:NodT family efflux transporter outer membrane factor (OMF) lipoprotein
LSALALAGCNLAPVYEKPKAPIPTVYKEVSGDWQPARPADTLPRGAWWKIYGDAQLDGLEGQVDSGNATLAEAAAAYDRARSLADEAKSGLFPSIGLNGYLTTDKQSARRPMRGTERPTYYGANALGASANYEIDLWGRVHNAVRAGKAQEQASAADLEAVRLMLHAELADDYAALRGLDEEAKLLADTVTAYTEAHRLTNNLFLGKIASRIDVTRAETQLHDAQAQVSDINARRALLEHSIATLTGKPPAALTIAPEVVHIAVPKIPLGVPSTLLERRPDIAAAERHVAAANARIGIAKAAFYPDISLGGSAGFQSTNIEVVTLPNDYWSIGPSVSLPLFEGGRLRAQLREARAEFDQATASYRGTVLSAFQEIDDNLALLHWLQDEEEHEQQAATAAQQTLTMSMNLYRNGAASYLDVVTAQTALLIAQRAALALQTRQLQASVGLIRALGGGWSTDDPTFRQTASNTP